MVNDNESKILDLVRMSGPSLPIKVSKALKIETYIAGAMLSSLVDNGHLKISQKRVGSSPLYYMPGQEHQVREVLFKELNDLEKKALNRLKELKVAFESDLYPQERFLLKELRDFATALTVKQGEQELTVWKHNSVTDEILNSILEERLKKTEPEKTPEPVQLPEGIQEKLVEVPIKEKPKEQPVKKRKIKTGEFANKVKEYLKEKEAELIEDVSVKKGEHLFKINIKTTFGNQSFLVKSLDKKRISESELSQFYLECMNEKKPGMLFVPAELSKKTKNFVDKNVGKMIKIVVIK